MNILQLKQIASSIFVGLFFLLSFISCEKTEDVYIEENKHFFDVTATTLQKGTGFLRQQENLGGHTIERHVGKSTAYLRHRLNTSSISAASTFHELNQAGQVIVNAINTNSNKVNNWLGSGGSRLTLSYTHRKNIGVILKRGESNPKASKKFRVILQKHSNAPNGFYVLTSYPN